MLFTLQVLPQTAAATDEAAASVTEEAAPAADAAASAADGAAPVSTEPQTAAPVILDAEKDNPDGVRSLSAQKSLSGPETVDFDGQALLLYEMTTGTLAYAKNIDEQREPASLTKIMTCLLALERGNLADSVTVSEAALADLDPDGSTAGLIAGETYTLEQLLFCLMVKSANDAASVIAEHISGSQEAFVELMNTRAAELGCKHTAERNGQPYPA